MFVAVIVADSDPRERAVELVMVGVWARPRGQDNTLGWLQVVPVCGAVLYEPLPCALQVRDMSSVAAEIRRVGNCRRISSMSGCMPRQK